MLNMSLTFDDVLRESSKKSRAINLDTPILAIDFIVSSTRT